MKNYKITFKELFDYLDNNIEYATTYLVKDQTIRINRYDWSGDDETENEYTYNTYDKFTIDIKSKLDEEKDINQELIMNFSRNSTNVRVLISKKITRFSDHQIVAYPTILTFIYDYDDNIPSIELIHNLYFTDIMHLILTGKYEYTKR